MKAIVIIAVIIGVSFGVYQVLGGQLGEATWQPHDAGVTGPLALGATSKLERTEKVWKAARNTRSPKDREELYVGSLSAGETFVVINHVQNGPVLWVEIEKTSDRTFRGYMKSPPDDPVMATLIEP